MADTTTKPEMLWLGGEMEIPLNSTPQEAYAIACNIAEQCGYIVTWSRGCRSMIEIAGGDIVGYYVLDWFSPDKRGIGKVEHWTCTAKYY
jgi:hypothetical protein